MLESKVSGSLYSEKQCPVGEGGGEEAQNLPETGSENTWVWLWLYEVEAGLEHKFARVDVPASHYPFGKSLGGPDRHECTHIVKCCCHLGEREPKLLLRWTAAEQYSTFLSPAGFRSGKGRPRLAPGAGRGVRKSS